MYIENKLIRYFFHFISRNWFVRVTQTRAKGILLKNLINWYMNKFKCTCTCNFKSTSNRKATWKKSTDDSLCYLLLTLAVVFFSKLNNTNIFKKDIFLNFSFIDISNNWAPTHIAIKQLWFNRIILKLIWSLKMHVMYLMHLYWRK